MDISRNHRYNYEPVYSTDESLEEAFIVPDEHCEQFEIDLEEEHREVINYIRFVLNFFFLLNL